MGDVLARARALLVNGPGGLYCPLGDFYVDPVRPVARAVITHGHADHARPGHEHVLATPETLAIMAARQGAGAARSSQALSYGEVLRIGDARISLHPAGHVLGSAQVLVEGGGARVVVSGDYKRRRDPTCPAFEPVHCDVFVTEATFGLPVFRHPPDTDEIAKLLRARALFPERALLVGVYALGKAQRLIALLREAGWAEPIYVHGALMPLCDLYERFGVRLGPLLPATAAEGKTLGGRIVLAPPSALADRWSRRLPDPLTALASGWMGVRPRARQRGVELPLIVSDHADWDELTTTIAEIDPAETWVTHGRDEALVRWAELAGRRAIALDLVGYEDEDD